MKRTALLLIGIVALFCLSISVFATGEAEVNAATADSAQAQIDNTNVAYSEDAETEFASDEFHFNELIEEMVEADNADAFFGEIVIDKTENTITKDGTEPINLADYGVNYPDSESAENLVATEPLFDAVGIKCETDAKTGEITLTDPSSQREIQLDGVLSDDNAAKDEAVYVTSEQLFDELAIEAQAKGDKIHITSPFQTKRIIVKANNRESDFSNYSAVKCISDGNGMYVLQYKTETDARNAYLSFKNDASIESVSIDKVYTAYNIEERYGAHTIQSDRYKQYLKEKGKNGKIIVAVIDTGVDSDHPFLKSRIISKGYNAYGENTNWEDDNGHGTHVSGIIVDNTPSNVKILPIKVLGAGGSGSSVAINLGIKKAVSLGADVINMSLGGTCDHESCAIEEATKEAINKGVTVVVAAGNECDDTKDYCPAAMTECITVASTTRIGFAVSSFSNYGKVVDLAAPGEMIISTQIGGGYCEMSGTSMATPFVAAAAAMLLTNDPALTPAKVESKLKSYSADMYSKGWDRASGYGVLNLGIALGDDIKADALTFNYGECEIEYFGVGIPYIIQPYVFCWDDNVVPTDRSVTVSLSDPSVADYSGNHLIPKKIGKTTLTLSLANGDTKSADINIVDSGTWLVKAAESYAGGKGTKKNPFLISNAEQLAKFSLDCLMKETKFSYKLTNDIDLSGRTWISADYMTDDMIHWIDNYDEAVFNGNNKKIKNMTVFSGRHSNSLWTVGLSENHNKLYRDNYGFFGDIKNAEIKNLGIENGYTDHPKGGLLANIVYENTHITKCYTSGFSCGNGLFGRAYNFNVKISDCYSSATVLRNGICTQLYSSLTPGGTTVNNVFFCGKQFSTQFSEASGGFVQLIDNVNSYQTYAYNCFSASKNINDAGFCEEALTSTISKCYYLDSNATGVKKAEKMKLNETTAKPEAFFKTKSNYLNSSYWNSKYKWDFNNVWAIDGKTNNGFPYLKNNKPGNIVEEKTDTWLDFAAESFAGGDGSENSPYLIENAQQLARISKLYRYGGGLNTYFKLIKDIDLSSHKWFPIGAGKDIDSVFNDKLPIRLTEDDGMTKYRFYGNIDGNGKTISNLRIVCSGDYVGFISIAQEGVIQNLNFVNASISGNNYCGVVTGLNRIKSSVINCSVSGNISFNANECGGAICGKNYQTAKIIGCTSAIPLCNKNSGLISRSFSSDYLALESEGIIDNCMTFKPINSPVIYNSYVRYESGNNVYVDIYGDYYGNIKECTSVKAGNLSAEKHFRNWDFENIWMFNSESGEPQLRECNYKKEKLPTKRWKDVATTDFAGGDGSKNNPYLIATAEQLAGIKKFLGMNGKGYFRLIKDIDLSGRLWDSSSSDGYFVVHLNFDGNGKTICGMTTKNGAGLFDYAIEKGNVIENLTMKDFHGSTSCAVVPSNYGTIKNCKIQCDTVSTSVFRGEDVILENRAGGIVGTNEGVIENCEVDVIVFCDFPSGAVADYNAGIIRNCSAKGFVLGMYADSISSGVYDAPVENCYSLATVVGDMRSTQTCLDYTNSYSAADFSGEQISSNVKYSADLKKKETFVGWDFDTVWAIAPDINGGYPYIRRPVQHTITYVLNGGTNPEHVQTDYIPGNICTLQKPSKPTCVFGGWYTDAQFKNKVTDVGAEDDGNITVYAKWLPGYTVSFDANGGKGTMPGQTIKCGAETKLSSNKFTRKDYHFLGWATTKDGKVKYKNAQRITDITSKGKTIKLYAVWEKDYYTVKFNSNGGSGKMSSKKININSTVALPENKFKRTGYYFIGWSTSYNGSRKYKNKNEVKNLASKNGVVILYAKWKAITYNIKFNANGGSGKMSTMKNIPYLDARQLYKNKFKPPKGKVFGGWSRSKNGKGVYTDRDIISGLTKKKGTTIILYAVWVRPRDYEITYKVGKGVSIDYTTDMYTSGKSSFGMPEPERKGYTFVGWCSDKALKSTPIREIKPYMSGDLVFYPKWKRNTYSVSYKPNGGSGKMSKQTDFGYNKYKALDKCTFKAPKGKAFAGWATSAKGKVVYKNGQKVKNLTHLNGKTVTLYAKWKSR